ncbi:unnamed protein product, partial [Brenthis ino]
MATQVNIIQWNCQSIHPKIVEFEQFLSQEKIHIAILSETWLDPNKSIRISGYHIVRQDRGDGYGGVAIVIHNSIMFQARQIQCANPGIQLVEIKLLNCSNLEFIISVYCPSSVHTVANDWDSVFSLHNNKTIIAGDFNGHHSNWSYKTDVRGTQLFDTIVDKDYVNLNDGSTTRLKLVNGNVQKSSPDVTFVTNDIALDFIWKVLNESLGSDHLIIKFTTANCCATDADNKKRNFKKAKWEEYRRTLHAIFSVLVLASDPQEAYNQFINAVNSAADRYIPTVRMCTDPLRLQKFVPKPYWNSDISRAVAERRLALVTFRKNPTPNNLDLLQIKVAFAQRIIRRAKRKAWRQFCNTINETISTVEMLRRMRWIKGYRLPKTYIDEDTANRLLRSLTPDYTSSRKPKFTSVNATLESSITIQEFNRAIKAKDTAPGDDSVSFSMLKHLPVNGKHILVKIYNMFLVSGFVPFQWRQAKIVPIPKASSSTQSIPEARKLREIPREQMVEFLPALTIKPVRIQGLYSPRFGS